MLQPQMENTKNVDSNYDICVVIQHLPHLPLPSSSHPLVVTPPHYLYFLSQGTSVIQLTATDADDPTYGNSARVVYSILEGQPYFSVDAKTGTAAHLLQNSL